MHLLELSPFHGRSREEIADLADSEVIPTARARRGSARGREPSRSVDRAADPATRGRDRRVANVRIVV